MLSVQPQPLEHQAVLMIFQLKILAVILLLVSVFKDVLVKPLLLDRLQLMPETSDVLLDSTV